MNILKIRNTSALTSRGLGPTCDLPARLSRRPSGRADGVARVLYAFILTAVISTAHAAQTVQVPGFSPNDGNLLMFKYVPDGLPAGAPLVVALHGCTQGAVEFDDESGWTELADRLGFALLFPEQQKTNNDRSCFNWFLADHNRRGRGEAASIMAMVDEMKAKHGIDPARIFVTGLSAGGAMTAVMLAAYPDVFRAGAIIAGIPYGCASTGGNPFLAWWRAVQKRSIASWYGEGGWAASQCGINLENAVVRSKTASRSPSEWRDLLAEAEGVRSAAWPKVSLWHGKDDPTVDPQNVVELMEQWTAAHQVDQVPEVDQESAGYRYREYKDGSGDIKVETFEFTTLGHSVPVSPGTGPDKCGRVARHFKDTGVCAASLIAKFWRLTP